MTLMVQWLLVVALMATSSACAGEPEAPPPQTGAAASTPPAAGTPGTGTAKPDTRFIEEQLALGEKEVGLARLAAERAATAGVKQFAETLLRDHQQAGQELRQIAERQQVTARPSAEQLNVERERLSKLSGRPFDQEYLDEMTADHEDAINDLEVASKDENADVRGWAVKTLPTVRHHLEQARQLRKSL